MEAGRGVPAGDRALLGSYETERKPHVAEMTRRAVLIGTAMTSTSPVARVLRGVILPRLDRIPAVRRMATESATPPLTLRPRGTGPLRGTLWPFPLGPVGSRGVLVSVRDDPGLRALCAGAGLEHRLLDATAWFGPSGYVLLRPDGTVFASTRDPRAMERELVRFTRFLAA